MRIYRLKEENLINILMANRDLLFIKSFINNMNDNQSKVLKIATNENETIEYITTTNIDIAILDLELYEYIEFELEKKKEKFIKSIIITSKNSIFRDELKNNPLIYCCIAQNSNVAFLAKKVKEMVRNKEKQNKITNIKTKIIKETNYLRYNPIYRGTNYLIECILLIAQSEDDLISNLEKYVYPLIAHKYNKTISNIKCNINQSTTHMYYECDSNRLQRYFNFECDVKPKPKLVMTTILNKVLK